MGKYEHKCDTCERGNFSPECLQGKIRFAEEYDKTLQGEDADRIVHCSSYKRKTEVKNVN